MSQSGRCIIIGVGNPFRHDDGIGPFIIELLRAQKVACDLLDAGTDALSLIETIKEYSRVIIIDAVNMNAAPGALKIFSPNEAKIQIRSDALTTHGFGLAQMLKLVDELKISVNITIVGIQPADISFGEGLTELVACKTDEILNWVKGQVFII